MNEKSLEKLIQRVGAKGKLSKAEKAEIIAQAIQCGEDPEEVKDYIELLSVKAKKKKKGPFLWRAIKWIFKGTLKLIGFGFVVSMMTSEPEEA